MLQMNCGVSVSKRVKSSSNSKPSTKSRNIESQSGVKVEKILADTDDKNWIHEAEFKDFRELKLTKEQEELLEEEEKGIQAETSRKPVEKEPQEEEESGMNESFEEDHVMFEPDFSDDQEPAVVVAPVQDKEEKKRLARLESKQGKDNHG